MAAFQQKSNDLHSYIQEIESREKNYRKFKVLAAILTFVLTLSIVGFVWLEPGKETGFGFSLVPRLSAPAFQQVNLDELDLVEAEKVLYTSNVHLVVVDAIAATQDTLSSVSQLKLFAQSHGLDMPQTLAEPPTEQLPYTRVDKMPYFPGGKIALARYLQSQLKYPSEARNNKVEGSVQVRFVIQPDGTITDVTVVEGIGYGCDREAIRLVSAMPRWIPGVQDGKSVAVYKALAIKFQLL